MKNNGSNTTDTLDLASRTLLEGLRDTQRTNQDSYALAEILVLMGFKPGKAAWVEVARQLSRIGGLDWTWKYADNVFRVRQRASEQFAHAIEVLRQQLGRQQRGAIAGAEMISIYAQPGQIPGGVVLPRSAKWFYCLNCRAPFIRTHPRQFYCDPSCTREARNFSRPAYTCPACGDLYPDRYALSGHMRQCNLYRLSVTA